MCRKHAQIWKAKPFRVQNISCGYLTQVSSALINPHLMRQNEVLFKEIFDISSFHKLNLNNFRSTPCCSRTFTKCCFIYTPFLSDIGLRKF